jgi:hypothetical protein
MKSITIIQKDAASKEALGIIFNPENVIACANYGGGDHCNEKRSQAKVDIWGARSEGKSADECMLARVINIDSEPAAMFNIGKTGTSPTVIDRTSDREGSVYEFSGLMVRDQYFAEGLDPRISEAVKGFMQNCHADSQFTKAIVTFSPTHPYQEGFLLAAGGTVLTDVTIKSKLGDNSMHPERFKVEDGQFYECTKWDSSLAKIEHTDWQDSDPCVAWAPKIGMVFDISDGSIVTHSEL